MKLPPQSHYELDRLSYNITLRNPPINPSFFNLLKTKQCHVCNLFARIVDMLLFQCPHSNTTQYFFRLILFYRMRQEEDKPALFITKLTNILRCKEHAKTITWDSSLPGIRILNQKRLEQRILPRYFRHSKISSFVRQLNMYDFHKVPLPDHRSAFLHPSYDPRSKQNLHLIKRKPTHLPSHPTSLEGKENSQPTGPATKLLPRRQGSIETPSRDFGREEFLEQLVEQLAPLKKNQKAMNAALGRLQGSRQYGRLLKSSMFRHDLQVRLGVDLEQDRLSQLSIEDELVFCTRKSLPQKSLKLLQSGPLHFKRETLGNFFNCDP